MEKYSAEKYADLKQAFQAIVPTEELEARLITYVDTKIDNFLRSVPPKRIEVKYPGELARVLDTVPHVRYELVLKTVAAKVPCALVGPAGGGKSTICEQVGAALGLEVHLFSFNPLSTKADLIGFVDARGNYHDTKFYKALKYGGLFVGDEADATQPGVFVLLNSAIANGKCTFANGETVTAHPNFRIIICMNTFGLGATVQYVGRLRLDAATLDRFAYILMDYDNTLEPSLISASVTKMDFIPDYAAYPVKDADEWYKIVLTYREGVKYLDLRHIISPRATVFGMRLAEQGIGKPWLTEMLLTKGLQGADIENLMSYAEARL